MSKVIVVSYTGEDYDTYLKLYSYSPAIVEMLKEDLKRYLREQGRFYLSTVKDWEAWDDAPEKWEREETPVYASLDQTEGKEAEITWENIEKNDEIYVTDVYNITLRIWKEEVVEAVENFDFDEE